ncbi:MAG TPA: hypothetical protein VME01_10770, partial [Solirubrobacteraceae bacterium]|nr:hypothetical protein [Solirubrobacteraceae bacterium]
MNGTVDINHTAADDEDGLDPHAAAALLEQTEAEAKREFAADAPQASLLGAALILIFYGAIYMAARGHHPYNGPTGPWLLAWPFGIIAGIVFNGSRYGRLTKNLHGVTLRRIRG